jgi:hypothetical protein
MVRGRRRDGEGGGGEHGYLIGEFPPRAKCG